MGYQSVVEPTIRQNIYNTIFTLVNTYKTTGWTVVSSFPEKDPVFPCIVINPAKIEIKYQGMMNSFRLNEAEIMIEVFAKASDRINKIDVIMDNLHDMFATYESTLRSYNLLISEESPIIDSETTRVSFNGQDLNTSAVLVSFQIR